jgi:putative acetyltransferase
VQVTITAVDWADPVGARLRRQDLEERGRLASASSLDTDGEQAGHVELFLIARDRISGRSVACGALRPLEPASMIHRGDLGMPRRQPTAAVALISWLFVVPECRRQGLARLVLAELELQARALGWFHLQLLAHAERQPALALCAAAGYVRQPDLAPTGSGGVVVFEKRLPPVGVEGWV